MGGLGAGGERAWEQGLGAGARGQGRVGAGVANGEVTVARGSTDADGEAGA